MDDTKEKRERKGESQIIIYNLIFALTVIFDIIYLIILTNYKLPNYCEIIMIILFIGSVIYDIIYSFYFLAFSLFYLWDSAKK